MKKKKADNCEYPRPVFQGAMTVGEKGQVVIPAELRKMLGLEKGSHLLTFQIGEVIVAAQLESLEKIATHSSGKATIIRELLKTIN
jgi:AbrB family looped-hinge helix DNA binding protein